LLVDPRRAGVQAGSRACIVEQIAATLVALWLVLGL
jgi:hypothetical protein